MTRTYEQIIADHKASRELDLSFLRQVCQEAWDGMNDNERGLIRFGMFPHDKMKDIEAKIAQYVVDAGGQTTIESKDSAVVLMEIAEQNGGMIA